MAVPLRTSSCSTWARSPWPDNGARFAPWNGGRSGTRVLGTSGRTVGVSTYLGYLFADRAWVSLAVVDETEAELGHELTVMWGEENGGSNRPLVERHVQMEVRATVAAWPFSKLARETYRKQIV
jgi:hypothetical protein